MPSAPNAPRPPRGTRKGAGHLPRRVGHPPREGDRVRAVARHDHGMIAAILALAGVFLLAPVGSRLFDGLPMNAAVEFVSAAALIVIAVSSPARATLAASPAVFRRTLLLLLAAAVIAKAAVVSRGRYDGLLACYQGAVARVDA